MNMPKDRYILLKNLPDLEKFAIFEYFTAGLYICKDSSRYGSKYVNEFIVKSEIIENCHEWFTKYEDL